MEPSPPPGFDPRVFDQLAQISLDQESRSTSRSSYHSASHHSDSSRNQYNTYIHPQSMYRHQNRPGSGRIDSTPPVPALTAADAFPPLGSTRPLPNTSMNAGQGHYQQNHNQSNMSAYNTQGASAAAQQFFSNARGNGRGQGRGQSRGRGGRQDINRQPPADVVTPTFTRPAPQQGHHPRRPAHPQSFGQPDQYRVNRHRGIDQADFLDSLTQKTLTNMLTRDEIQQKHIFRQRLELLAKAVSEIAPLPGTNQQSLNLRMQSYGSLSNSFGTSGCDVDLLLTVERSAGDYVDITEQYKRDLEKALLEQGIGARLLTNTRIPIIRVCEKPTTQLLDNLWENRRQREAAELTDQLHIDAPLPQLSESQGERQFIELSQLDPDAARVPLPQTPVLEHAQLEFVGDCGVQCDINFTNHVALHNTKMLWTYGQCDVRVRHLGIFVKNWAKARAINTPYHGTLSSYGYVLMVLHYLMNVVHPPVIPNLQQLAIQDTWGSTPVDLFEGHDVRFTQDMNRIRESVAHAPKNQSSLGGLLLGFYRYYATHDGFNWTQDVISIRSFGGILSKQAKGWTGAKWTGAKQNVRLRYLLAIEDPFELEHNVARTVGHNGIKAVRDEFRRAWSMIQGVQRVSGPQGTTWSWANQNQTTGGDAFDLVKPSEDRGDLLKKDADFRKDQLRLLKQKTEAEEQLAKSQVLTGTSDDEHGDTYGMSAGKHDLTPIDGWEDQAKLIHDLQLQDSKVSRMRGPDAIYRKATSHEDDSETEDQMYLEMQVAPIREPYMNRPHAWSKYENLPGSSDPDSDDWATAHETTSYMEPYSEEYDETMKNNQDQWDDWNHGHENLRDSIGTHLDWDNSQPAEQPEWDEVRQRVIQGNWDDTPAHYQSALTSAHDDQTLPSAAVEWDQEIPDVNEAFNATSPGRLSPRAKREMRSSLPPPHSVDNLVQPSQDFSARRPQPAWQQNGAGEDPDSVGHFIAWSRETVGGRWLLNRDARIRDGRSVEITSGDKGVLNAKFPYDPRMTSRQLAEKNILLERYYKNSLYSRSPEAERAPAEVRPTVPEDSWDDDTSLIKPDVDKIINAGLIRDGVYWSTMTGVGEWLCWRDRKILAGVWKPRDSLAAAMTVLFPRTPKTTVGDMMRMNSELDLFFDGLDYPRPHELTHKEMDEQADAIRDAIQRTQQYRATKSSGDNGYRSQQIVAKPVLPNSSARSLPKPTRIQASPAEDVAINDSFQEHPRLQPTTPTASDIRTPTIVSDDKSRILLDMFKSKSTVYPNESRNILDPKDKEVVNQRSLKALMNLSDQLSMDPPKDADFVRAQRLAFFQRQTQTEQPTSSAPVNLIDFEDDNNNRDGRKDSGTEGIEISRKSNLYSFW